MWLILALVALLVLFLLPTAMIGALVLFHTIVMPMKAPCDTSNRIAHFRLVWWALIKPEMFVKLLPWLRRDEGDNLKN